MEAIILNSEGNKEFLPVIYRERVRITILYNPFNPRDKKEFKVPFEIAKPVSEYVSELNLITKSSIELAYSVNGRVLDSYDAVHICPNPGDQIVVISRVHGGGNSVARIIGFIVITIATILTYGAAAKFYPVWVAATAAAVVATVGGLIVNALFPITPPTMPTLGATAATHAGALGEMDQTQTYGWGDMGNLQNQGFPIPRLYGKRRIAGNIINRFIEQSGNNQYINILQSLCEGCIISASSVELNKQPIGNYTDAWQNATHGRTDQLCLQYFGDTFNRQSYSVELTTGSYITKQTEGDSAEGLRFEITCPNGLFYSAADGSINSTNVEIIMEYRIVGAGSWVNFASGEGGITSYTNSTYTQRGFLFVDPCDYITFTLATNQLPNAANNQPVYYRIGSYPSGDTTSGWRLWGSFSGYNVSVTITGIGRQPVEVKITESPMNQPTWWTADHTRYINTGGAGGYVNIVDASNSSVKRTYTIRNLPVGQYEARFKVSSFGGTTARYINKTYLVGISELIPDDFTYPSTALLGVRVLATSQISGNRPTVTCIADRGYVPVHDGTEWVAKSSDNPAWASYDILTRPVYDINYDGSSLDVHHLEGVDYSRIIYADFLVWANHCDTYGYTVDIYFDSQMSIWSALAQVGQMGHGSVVMKGTKFSCVIDKTDTVRQWFSTANVYTDSVKINYLPLEDRANMVEVTYFDEDRSYQRETFPVYGNDYNTALIVKKAQITLHGCINYDRAWKFGDFLLKSNLYLIRAISFDADVDAIGCQIGDVIAFQCDLPQWGYSGRVVSATSNTVTLDKEVTLDAVSTYKIHIRDSDTDTFEEQTVTTSNTTTDTLTISGTWTITPEKYDIFLFGVDGSEYKNFRISAISRNGELKRTIQGAEYNASMYVEGTPTYLTESALTVYPVATELDIAERLRFNKGGAYVSELHITWEQTSGSAEGFWRIHRKNLTADDAFWQYLGETSENTFISSDNWQMNNQYEIAVVGVSDLTGATDSVENVTTERITIRWKQAKPDDVENFTVYQDSDRRVYFNWDHITDVDRDGYRIKEGPTWGAGTIVVNLVQQNSYDFMPTSDGSKIYMIKAVDDSGNESSTEDSVSLTVRNVLNNLNVIITRDEITLSPTPCPGTKDNCLFVAASTPYLGVPHAFLDDDEIITGWLDTTANPDITSYEGDSVLTGSYITEIIDCTISDDISIKLDTEWESQNISTTDLTYPDRLDTTYPNDTDISITSELALSYYYRYSTGADPTGESWLPYSSSVEVEARTFQIKFAFELDNTTSYLKFTKLAMTVDVPDIDYVSSNQSVSASGTTFNMSSDFGLTFQDHYVVGITVIGSTGLYPVMSNDTLTVFDVKLYDSDGNTSDGTVKFRIKGF